MLDLYRPLVCHLVNEVGHWPRLLDGMETYYEHVQL
jgi:hypothetical protein